MHSSTLLAPFLTLLAVPLAHADFYVVSLQQTSQGGGGLSAPPIGGASVAYTGIIPVDKADCDAIGKISNGGDLFHTDKATNTIPDDNCSAGIITFTGTGGNNWDVDGTNGDTGTCSKSNDVSKWCVDGLAVGTLAVDLVKCQSTICG